MKTQSGIVCQYSEAGFPVKSTSFLMINTLQLIHDGGRHSMSTGCVAITQIMHQLQLELLQSKEALIERERTVCHHPEHIRIDDADVEKPPEDVLPPTPASSSHTVVRAHLVEMLNVRVL